MSFYSKITQIPTLPIEVNGKYQISQQLSQFSIKSNNEKLNISCPGNLISVGEILYDNKYTLYMLIKDSNDASLFIMNPKTRLDFIISDHIFECAVSSSFIILVSDKSSYIYSLKDKIELLYKMDTFYGRILSIGKNLIIRKEKQLELYNIPKKTGIELDTFGIHSLKIKTVNIINNILVFATEDELICKYWRINVKNIDSIYFELNDPQITVVYKSGNSTSRKSLIPLPTSKNCFISINNDHFKTVVKALDDLILQLSQQIGSDKLKLDELKKQFELLSEYNKRLLSNKQTIQITQISSRRLLYGQLKITIGLNNTGSKRYVLCLLNHGDCVSSIECIPTGFSNVECLIKVKEDIYEHEIIVVGQGECVSCKVVENRDQKESEFSRLIGKRILL